MNRKTAVLLVSVPIVCGIAAVAGVYWFKPDLLSSLPYFAKFTSTEDTGHKPSGEKQHDAVEAGAEPKHETNAEQHAEPKHETNAEQHPAPLKQASADNIVIEPAADFVAPRSQTDLASRAMREISTLQSRMAQGDNAAPPELKAAMLRAGKIFVPRDGDGVSPHDFESMVQYVLSGGDPAAAAVALRDSKLDEQQRHLVEGVLSYVTADLGKAKEKLLPLDATRYGMMLDAHLTMVQVQLDERSDVSKSLKRLAYVANIVPGTLIEEAAIRRMMPLLDRAHDTEKFLYWAKRYLRRYPNSLYHEDFELDLIDRLLKASAADAQAFQRVLEEIFGSSQQAQVATLSRRLMTAAVDTGNSPLCDAINKSLSRVGYLEIPSLSDTRVLLAVCEAAEADEILLEELRGMAGLAMSETTKTRLEKAIAMAESINNNSPLQDDGHFGPYLPLSQSDDYTSLFASVAQQIETSLSAVKKADGHETRVNN